MIWTKERVFEASKSFDSLKDFKNGGKGAYNAAYRNGWLDEIKLLNKWTSQRNGRAKGAKNKNHSAYYIDKQELLEEVIACKKNNNTISPKLLSMMIMLVDRMSLKFSYKEPSDREDTKGEAIFLLLKYWHKFDPSKSENAFAYMTQIAKNGLGIGWRILCNEGQDWSAGVRTKRKRIGMQYCRFLEGTSENYQE